MVNFINKVMVGLTTTSPADNPEDEKLLYAVMTHIRDVKLAMNALKVRGARGSSLGPILQVGAHLLFQDPPRRSLTSAPVCTNVHFLDYTMESF